MRYTLPMEVSDYIHATKRRQAYILACDLIRRGIVAERVFVCVAGCYGWLLKDIEISAVIGEAQASVALAQATALAQGA